MGDEKKEDSTVDKKKTVIEKKKEVAVIEKKSEPVVEKRKGAYTKQRAIVKKQEVEETVVINQDQAELEARREIIYDKDVRAINGTIKVEAVVIISRRYGPAQSLPAETLHPPPC